MTIGLISVVVRRAVGLRFAVNAEAGVQPYAFAAGIDKLLMNGPIAFVIRGKYADREARGTV